MFNEEPIYPNAINGELVYAEYVKETNMFGVFGEESGHCYSTWSDMNTAEQKAEEYNQKDPITQFNKQNDSGSIWGGPSKY